MMFRSLFFAPLLVSADVEEQSVLLQMKGRAETQVLMQRASEGISSETLRSLEMGLMAKGPKKVETAKCAYYMKTGNDEDYAGTTPCELMDVLEELYEKTFDHFDEFNKLGDKAVNEILKAADSSLKIYPDVNLTASFEYNSTNLGLKDTKFHKAFVNAVDKLGDSMNETDIYGALNDHVIFSEAEDAFEQILDVQDNVVSMLKGEGLLSALPVNSTFNVTAMQEEASLATGKGRLNARKMIETYAVAKKGMFLNLVGEAVANFWKDQFGYEGDALSLDWTVKKDTKNARKLFYTIAAGFLDDVENVEPICTSAEFNAKQPILRKVCKGSSKPKCLDELMFLNDDTTDICAAADSKAIRKVRSRKFTDQKFLDYCNATTTDADLAEDALETPGADCELYFRDVAWTACRRVNDIRKGCRSIARFEKAEAKKVLKLKKKAFNKAKKDCYKACKTTKDRSEKKACKKKCKTDFHKSMLTNFTVPEPEAATE